MRTATIYLLLQCSYLLAVADESESRDLDVDYDNEDLERKLKKKRKKQQQFSPCGYGRSFGFADKLFGQSQPDYTYINAPVNNYYIGCGGAQYAPQSQGHGAHGGHGGHGGQGGHGHGGLGGHGGHGGHGQGNGGHGLGSHGNQNYGNQQFGGFNPFHQQNLPGGNNHYPQNNPVQSAFSSAASSLGTALADYITRPKKVQRQINRLIRPIYRLF